MFDHHSAAESDQGAEFQPVSAFWGPKIPPRCAVIVTLVVILRSEPKLILKDLLVGFNISPYFWQTDIRERSCEHLSELTGSGFGNLETGPKKFPKPPTQATQVVQSSV